MTACTRRGARAVLALACVLPFAPHAAAPAAAQGLATGAFQGFVSDSAGRAIPGAVIILRNEATGRQHVLRSSRSGQAEVLFLGPGRYSALTEAIGYVPQRAEDILVEPGHTISLSIRLPRAGADAQDRLVRPPEITVMGGGSSAPQDWLTARDAAALPLDGLGLGAAALLSSRAGPLLDVEGLPAQLSTLVVDGVPVAPRPRSFWANLRAASLALSTMEYTDLLTTAADVEWPGAAAGYFMGLSRQGLHDIGGQLFGDWSGDQIGSGSQAPPFQSYRIGGQLGGAVVPDTAYFMIGGELLRSEVPFESLWVADTESARLVDIVDQAGLPLDRYARPTVDAFERASAFGRLDLRLGGVHDLSVAAHAALLPKNELILPGGGLLLGPGAAPESRDISATVTVLSRLGDNLANEVHGGFELSRYTREAAAGGDDLALEVPSTAVAAASLEFGWPDDAVFEHELVGFYLRETLHHRAGSHQLKYGVSGLLPTYTISWDRDEAGRFVFPTVDDLMQRRGLFRRATGEAPVSDFSIRHWTFYAQDTWRAAADLDLLFGIRYTFTRWPDYINIPLDFAWRDLTGLSNQDIPSRPGHWEPVAGFTWAPGGGRDWLLRGSVLVDGLPLAPELFAEVASNSGQVDVFSGIGELGSWPAAPDTARTPFRGHTLSLFGPRFRGPTTTRLSASIARTLGELASIEIAGTWRETSYLPRRRDVNLLPHPTALDQHGRPVRGQLSKVGALVASEPGTNRRITEYERVWAIEATGQSTYRGLTVSVRRPMIGPLALFASYTASETEDDWLGAGGLPLEAQLPPFADSTGATPWAESTSDLDVPHRFLAGVDVRVPGRYGPRIAGLYRFQSGYPFTPGLPEGVDVNGDGSGVNDPAFLDPQIAGTGDLTARWSCLAGQLGQFARRNSCRGPSLHTLDARLTLEILQSGRYSANVVLDALNLLSSDFGEVDRAVYVIDPASPLGGNQAAGTVVIPYVVNPRFGELRTRYAPQRMIRLGLRVTY